MLTPAGLLLNGFTKQAFQALTEGINALSPQQSHVLNVSCEPTLTMRWLMPRLAHFYAQAPEVDVRLSTAGGPVEFARQSIDLAIRRDDFVMPSPYNQIPLVEEWLGPVCSPSYWQQIQQDVTKATLLHSDTRPRAWQDWLEAYAIASPNSAMPLPKILASSQHSYAHFYFCLQAAMDGLGAAIGSYPLVADDLKRGTLVAPFGFMASGHQYVVLSPNQTLSPVAQAFIDWLQGALTDCLPAVSSSSTSI